MVYKMWAPDDDLRSKLNYFFNMYLFLIILKIIVPNFTQIILLNAIIAFQLNISTKNIISKEQSVSTIILTTI